MFYKFSLFIFLLNSVLIIISIIFIGQGGVSQLWYVLLARSLTRGIIAVTTKQSRSKSIIVDISHFSKEVDF